MNILWKRIGDLIITKKITFPNGQSVDTNGRLSFTASGAVLNVAEHAAKPLTINLATGVAFTLPAAVGSGAEFRFVVGTTMSGGSTTIKVANASDVMNGFAIQAQDAGAAVQMFEAAAADDTITLNGTTTGGIRGDRISLIDIAPNVWAVEVISAGTGTEATPFSATV
jgi:hypothetical protein